MKIIQIITIVAALTGTAWGGTPTATDAIRTANDRLRELLSVQVTPGSEAENKNTSRITSELQGLFDIGDLTRRALVDHWDKMTPAQRTAIVNTLQRLVERNYLGQLRSNLAYELVYQGEEPRQDDVVVKTAIKAKQGGRPFEIAVEYVLHHEGQRWRAYDVITDTVSLVTNYRSQFNKIIAKKGVDGLIGVMKAKLDKGNDE